MGALSVYWRELPLRGLSESKGRLTMTAATPAAHHREVAGHCDVHNRPVWMCIRELEAELVLPDDWELCPTCGRTRDGAAERIRELEAELEKMRYELRLQ